MRKNFKLSGHIRPTNYSLFFDVDNESFEFIGKEEIGIEFLKPVTEIVLNAVDLKISNVVLIQGGMKIKPKIKLGNHERIALKFAKAVQGSAKLLLEFGGKLNDNLLGFYRSKYMHNGKEKYMATTQFEAPYARRAFPCFDEPQLKATFEVSLKIDKGLRAVSNMPIKEEVEEGDKKTVKFQRTPKMSTYLLYIGIGEFEFLEDKLDEISIRIATTPGKKEQCSFALGITKKFLSYFQEYSGIAYPLPKLDLIALPDFIVGAMENWGAITFRELYLLFDKKTTSTATKKRMAMIIAHELWHQWSGDLVTMRWWNDLWLNESFATLMAYKAVDHFFPEWNIWEDFIRAETERALDDDSLRTTHPIEVKIKNPHEIEEIFDAISYSKGGSILRMLESYLGEETFRKGVGRYLSEYKYANATSEDLWNSLAGVSNKPIKEIMVSWIGQAGYPLVEVSLNKILSLRQKRFVFGKHSDAKWIIPLVIKINNKFLTELLAKTKKSIILEKKPEVVKVNYGQSGFYRAAYDAKNLAALKRRISEKSLPALDRWGIQNDSFKISLNGNSLREYLDLLKYYQNEDKYLVLSSINSAIHNINSVFYDGLPMRPKFKNHVKEPFRKALNKLRWEPRENEPQEDALLRELSIFYLAFVEEPGVIKIGLEKFDAYSKGHELHPDIKSAVCYIAAANGDRSAYEKILRLYLKTQSPEEKRILLASLGHFRNPDILKEALDFSLSDKVRKQDMAIVFSSAAANPLSRSVLFEWTKKKWKRLETYKKSGQIFLIILESLITAYASKDMEKELKKFFAAHPVKYRMTLNRAFEKMKRSISFKKKNKAVMKRYFS